MLENARKILTPIDFSEYSFRAMQNGYELAKEVGAEFHLLHVVAPHHMFIPLPLTGAEGAREMAREASMVEQAEQELARIKKDQLEGSNKVTIGAVVGPPVGKIVEYVNENGIDLVVLAAHGRTGLAQIRIGSVAEKLVRNLPCSVLVLRR
ncbi:MAG: universal stress protein [Candidatus Binataceae bacterium]